VLKHLQRTINVRIFVITNNQIRAMKTTSIFHKGTEILKINLSTIEDLLEEKGIDVFHLLMLMGDEQENIYVSRGFKACLSSETTAGEWHHYFIKDGKDFISKKYNF